MPVALTSVGASLPAALAAEVQAQVQRAPVQAVDAGVVAQIYGKALYLVSGILHPRNSYAETWGPGSITCLVSYAYVHLASRYMNISISSDLRFFSSHGNGSNLHHANRL
jgi:hypothetical protein